MRRAPTAPVPAEGAVRPVRVVVRSRDPLFSATCAAALAGFPDLDVVPLAGLGEGCIDVVLVHRGEADDDSLLRQVQRDHPRVPVVAVSACDPRRGSGFAAGHAAVWCDPSVGVPELVRAIRAAARGGVPPVAAQQRVAARTGVTGVPALTPRERQVLLLLAEGATTSAIAASLQISTHTARTHVRHLLDKLGVRSRLEAAAYGARHGLL
jgi:two-component system, NarL family, nitrate/nitrite response regulator NarL